MVGMAGPQGAMAGAAASMGVGAISSIGNSVGDLFGGPSRPKFDENINYACVADVQITDRALTGGVIAPATTGACLLPGSIKRAWLRAYIRRSSIPRRPRR